MQFEKGHEKTGGRSKGTSNKISTSFREKVLMLLENQYAQIEKDMKALAPEDRIEFWVKLMEFAIPKLQRSEATIETVEVPEEKSKYVDLDFEDRMKIATIIAKSKHKPRQASE